VAARGRERAREAEEFERVGVGGENFGGSGVVEKIGEEGDEAADEGRVGVGAEVAAAIAEFGDEPDLGGAAGDVVRGRAVGGRQRGAAAGALDGSGEAFLRIVEEGELVEQGLLLSVAGHGKGEAAE